MKELELRQHATCSLCNQPIGASGLPLFYVVKVERFGVKLDAVRRQDGLTALLGGHAGLAQVMGTDAEMTETLMPERTLTVCETCSTSNVVMMTLTQEEDG